MATSLLPCAKATKQAVRTCRTRKTRSARCVRSALSSEAMTRKFDLDRHAPRDIVTDFEKRFSVGSYLAYQGKQFVGRFDANSYVAVTLAMDNFDLGDTREKRLEAFGAAQCDWLVISFSSDWLFPPDQSRELVSIGEDWL